MQRYCAGDAEAFRTLYAHLAPRLLAYLIGLIGERPAAEDLLQQTFLKIHSRRHVYVSGADPVPWMYTIAHRMFLDEARRRRRGRERTADHQPADEPRAQLSGAAEGDADLARGLDPAMLAALQELPETLREALILTKVEGRTHREAAEIAGTTPGAMKLRAHRGYEKLRRRLASRERP